MELANNEEQDDLSDGEVDNGADLNSSSNSAYIHSEYASYRHLKYTCDHTASTDSLTGKIENNAPAPLIILIMSLF